MLKDLKKSIVNNSFDLFNHFSKVLKHSTVMQSAFLPPKKGLVTVQGIAFFRAIVWDTNSQNSQTLVILSI